MDRFKFTTIGHSTHRLCSPIGEERLVQLIEAAALQPSDTVLDLAAGKAELSLRLLERYDVSAVAVDHSPNFVSESREEALRRDVQERIRVVEADAGSFDAQGERFDLVICVGARPFGDRAATLRALLGLTKRSGKILIGEGYWKCAPSPELLSFLGCAETDYGAHADNIALGESVGLKTVHASECSVEEMDAYDGQYRENIERFLADHPDDPDAAAIRERLDGWRDAYFKWVRSTLGFGVYLFRTQAAAD